MSHSATAVVRSRKRRRTLLFELLEDRRMLSLTPADLTSEQRDVLQAGLESLVDWADELDGHGLMAMGLPVAGQTLGLSLDFGSALRVGLFEPVEDYFDTDPTPTTAELVDVLQGLTATYGDLNITVDPGSVQGGLKSDPGGDRLEFELTFQAQRNLVSHTSLGPRGDAMGLLFDPIITTDLEVAAQFDFRFGIDVASGIDPEDAFFVAVNSLEMTAEVDPISPQGDFLVGFYDAKVVAGTLNLDAALAIDIAAAGSVAGDPILWRELDEMDLVDLVTFTPSGTATGDLTLTADPFAGFTPGPFLTISFQTNDPFDPPELTFSADFDDLLPFTNLSVHSALGVVEQLGWWFDQARHTPLFDVLLPLLGNSRFGDEVPLGDAILHPDTGLIGQLLDSDQQPTFRSVQEFSAALQNALGPNGPQLNPAYDPNTRDLTFQLLIDHTFVEQTLPLDLNLDLDPLGSLETSSTIELSAEATLDFVLGINLTDPQAVLMATATGPANGQLSDDANFSLKIGGRQPVAVTVPQSATAGNTSLADLADDMNDALDTAGLAADVVAGVDGDRITLTTIGPASEAVIRLQADAGDPILTEVHLVDNQLATDSVTQHTFVEQASVAVSAEIRADEINAAARFGFLGVEVLDGEAQAQASVGFALTAPNAGVAGGRVYLPELYAGLGPNIGDITVQPTIQGSASATLPLQVTPNFLGADHPGDPRLTFDWPDITDPGTLNVDLHDVDLLLNFTEWDSSTLIDALVAIATYLADAEGFSLLAQEMPGIHRSLSDIIGFADEFIAWVNSLQDKPAAILQDVESAIEDAFGLDPSVLDLSLADNNSVLRLSMTIEESLQANLPINLSLEDLGISGLTNLIDVHGAADLAVEAGAFFQLDFGLDLSDPLDPRPFLYETTALGLTARVEGSDIHFTTALGPLGVWIKDGSLLIDGDGNPATTDDPVLLGLTLDDGNPATDRIYLDELSLSHLDLGLSGQAHLTLPLYAPTESSYLGDIVVTVTDLGDLENTTTLTAPNLEDLFGSFDLINNLGGAIDAIDFVLANIQEVLSSDVLSHTFPMIGSGLEDASTFIQDIRTDVIQGLRDRFGESLNNTAEVIQQSLFEVLGPDGLDFLLDANQDGLITEDDISVLFSDTSGDGVKDDQIDVSMMLGRQMTLVDTPIEFDLGIPALGLGVDGNVQLELGFVWELGFGVSRDDGFYLHVDSPNELALTLEARIPELQARGELLFLELDVADDMTNPSAFDATIAVDIVNPFDSQDPKLRFSDLAAGGFDLSDLLQPSIEGGAAVNLDLDVSFAGDSRFPSMGAQFAMLWEFSAGLDGLSGDVPSIAFNNVVLDAGQFVSDFSESILREVQKVTDPLQPIVDFLTEPLPILEDFGIEITVLQIVERLGLGDVASFVGAVGEVITMINTAPVVTDEVLIPLGSFDLSGTDPREEENLSLVEPNVTTQVDAEQQMKSLPNGVGAYYSHMTSGKDLSIKFPIIENPADAFKLLLGQDIDLVRVVLPSLRVGVPFPIVKVGPLIPPIPIFASIGGFIGAGIDLEFGFDTHGLRKFLETDDPLDIFSGFFISKDKDAPEATLTGVLNAGLELSLAVVGAGVSGGVAIDLFASLNDPNNDGKVHLDEFLGNLELGLLSTFDVGGAVTAKLDAFVELLFVRHEFQLAEFTVIDFELTDSDIYVDRFISGGSSGQSTAQSASSGPVCSSITQLGIGPGLHVDGLSLGPQGLDRCFEFELLRTDSVDVDIRHSFVQGDLDLEVYDADGNLLGASRTDRDREIVSLIDVPAGTYYARVSGQRNNFMLAVEPGETSSTRVIYVNPASQIDRSNSYYTTLPGNDQWSGLLHRRPKATLQNVLDTYQLGPDDIIVLDTGYHEPGALITAADQGATFVGSLAGSYISGIHLDGADDSLFEMLRFAGSGTGILIGAGSEGNTIRRSTFAGIDVGVHVDSTLPNLIEDNHFLTPQPNDTVASDTGIHLVTGAASTVRGNDIAGRATGIYSDSLVANIYGNTIHANAVGMSSRRGVLGPNNPAPVGSPGGLPMNEVYDNGIGILVPPEAVGVWVRFNEVHSNQQAGIEQWGTGSVIVANDVHNNPIGIHGSHLIGPDQWGSQLHNLVHHNGVGILAEPGTEVRYNRVFANATGIQVADDTYIHHNLIYRNTGHGILVDGARQVQLIHNTVYAPAGNGVHLQNGADEVTIRNNILYAESGYALYVAADSQFGYQSDYNNLFATGAGRVAFQGKDFYDVYDWQVETDNDLHSIGRTDPAPGLDDPLFVSLADDDYRLQPGSTSIDSGDPASDFSLEPEPNGGRVNLGAYGNTPLATTSESSWLRIASPNFYADLIPSHIYEIRWETFNVPGTDTIDVVLLRSDGTKVADIASTVVSTGSIAWSPGQFVTGDPDLRYQIELSTSGATSLIARSREPFSVPDVDPSLPQTYYVNDRSDAGDQYTTAIGNNRNTGTTADDPKEVIRPLVLSYPLGAGDVVLVDTGDYVHAVNLNLSASFQADDPRMNSVSQAQILGPTDPAGTAWIDRANPYPGAKTIDIIGAPGMVLKDLTLSGAYTGLHVRDGSHDFVGERLIVEAHTADGLVIEGDSHDATLDELIVRDNGGHGIFVESRLNRITHSEVHGNGAIGIALRNVGVALVETSRVYDNLTGIDILNPGLQQAVIGHADLDQQRGNLVYQNTTDGIYASGSVMVAGNTVAENGQIGIHLNDGADAWRNVVRQHTSGIWALGSESHILENRSYANSDTGIAASFDSRIERNVTYTNGIHGILVDWYSGVIDHNVVYDTGDRSIVVQGPGAGASLINNTVYEPCEDNRFVPPPDQTVIEIPWQWHVMIERFPDPDGTDPGGTFPMLLTGLAQVRFGEPVGEQTGETFDLGPGGGSRSETADPVPPGQRWTIPIEIVALDLRSDDVPGLGEVWGMLQPTEASVGSLSVELVEAGPPALMGAAVDVPPEDDWMLVGDSTLDLHLDFVLPNEDQLLISLEPMKLGTEFDFFAGLGAHDALRMAVPLFIRPDGGPVPLVAADHPDELWGQWFMEAGLEDTRPQDKGQYCANVGIHVLNDSHYVTMRNNAVFVEGGQTAAGQPPAHVVIVEADSTLGWDSDFNLLSTVHGATGRWAGVSQWTLADWQNASRDDYRSIDDDPDLVWVDPDGDDDRLGFVSVGLSDGRDDNLHLRSRYGHVLTGALAPVEHINATQPGLPEMQPVIWGADFFELSPAVDWGDPSHDFGQEPMENGQIINLGAYGNTDQASLSPPYYIHLVYPLGREELVGGRDYLIQWRSRLPASPPADLEIELRRDDKDGPLETTIATGIADTGSYLWTVPATGIPRSNHYVIVIRWPGDPADPNDDVVGQSRRRLTVDGDGLGPGDTRPPTVRDVTPRVVHHSRSTNDDSLDRLVLEFSEPLDSAAAANPASYELIGAGSDGQFDTADDVVVTFTATYTAGPTDGDPSQVVLDLSGPLPPESYRLTIDSSAIVDKAGLALDGDDSGTAGGDYVRHFVIDRTPPTVQIVSVSPDLRNESVPSISIVFSEPVQGFGMADLRLTRDGGSNLLTGGQSLASTDLVTWTLGGLDPITSIDGSYALELIAADSGIVDLAGNPLGSGATETWVLNTTNPTVQVVPVSPNPRNSAVGEIVFVFSEPVTGFAATDLTLRRNGGANLLTAANSVSSSDGITWTLTGLAPSTHTEGIYALELVAANSQTTDLAGNALSGYLLEVWKMDVSVPVAHIVPVVPGPRNTPIDTIDIQFNEPVTGLTVADLRLTANSGPNRLTGGETLTTRDNMSWRLSGLTAITASEGGYRFTLIAAGSGIIDRAGNPLIANATTTWTVDLTAPQTQIVPIDPDPRTQPIESLEIVFSEPVFGFDAADLMLTRDGGGNLLSANQTLSTSDGVVWILENLTSLTSASGQYALRLTAAGSGIIDAAGNPLDADAQATWLQDLEPPQVERIEPLTDPLSRQVTAIEFTFSEPIVGLNLSAIRLFHDDQPIDLFGTASLSSADQITWTLDDLSDLTHAQGEYGLEMRSFGSGIRDLAGNLLPTGGTATWQMGNAWHNHANPFDVNGQDGVTALDVLILINYINNDPHAPQLPPAPPLPPPYLDVNNDGFVTAEDVLLVINYINSQLIEEAEAIAEPEPEAEAEAEAKANSSIAVAALHLTERIGPPTIEPSVGPAIKPDRTPSDSDDPPFPTVEPRERDFERLRLRERDTFEPRFWDSHSLASLDEVFAEWDPDSINEAGSSAQGS